MKEAKAEFTAHIERVKELVANMRRAGADIKARKASKCSRAQREMEKHTQKVTQQASAAAKAAAKAAATKAAVKVAASKSLKKAEGDELTGKPAVVWNIMETDLSKHVQIQSVPRGNFDSKKMDTAKPYIIAGMDFPVEMEAPSTAMRQSC